MLYLISFSFSHTDASKGLRNLTLSVYPEVIRRGQSAQLHCNYEVFDVPLYSVKWYRGIFEFYRYTPFEHPPGKTFFFNTGIKVDVSILTWIMNGYPCLYFFYYVLHFSLLIIWMGKFASFNKIYLHRKIDSMYHAKICKLESKFTAKSEQAFAMEYFHLIWMGKCVVK